MTQIDLGEIGELKRLADRATADYRRERSGAFRPVRTTQVERLAHIVRRQTAALIVLAVMVGLLFGAFLAAPGANSVVPAVPAGVPTVVELYVFGPGPASEAIAHVAYVDGTESELPPGVYQLGGLAGAQMQIMSEDIEAPAGCRIIVDNVIVAEAVAELDGYHAVCRWEAP